MPTSPKVVGVAHPLCDTILPSSIKQKISLNIGFSSDNVTCPDFGGGGGQGRGGLASLGLLAFSGKGNLS
jgi:hypothetical protein